MSDAARDRLPLASARQVARAVLRAVGRTRWVLVPLVVLLLCAAALGLVPAFLLGALVDVIATREVGIATVGWFGAAIAGASIAAAVLVGVGMVIGARLLETTLASLRERMMRAAFALPQSRVERAGTGDLVSRAGDDVSEVAEAIPGVVPALTGSLFTIVLTLLGMAVLDPWYAVALLAVTPIHVLAIRRYVRDAPGVYAAERAAMADRAQGLLESLYGLDTVHAFRLGASHTGRIARASWAVVRWSIRAVTIQNAFFARLNLGEFLGMGALLAVSFLLVDGGHTTLGAATAAMLLFLRLFNPVNELLFVVDELQSAYASLSRIVGIIVTVADRPAPAAAARPADDVASLRLDGVGHAYTAGHPVLRDVTLTLEPGETVAIVGASGAGKSTLAALAAGIHDPAAGTVTRGAGRTVLVTQETHVFDGTLRDNLTLARPSATDADLHEALTRIGAADLVQAFADGLDTAVGAGGAAVSPAHAQLLALARVELAAPALVVLDEATAEAGSMLAGRLDHAARVVIEGRTAVVVTHRLGQTEGADRIVVLAAGEIVESGSHEALLAADGEYARHWRTWTRRRP